MLVIEIVGRAEGQFECFVGREMRLPSSVSCFTWNVLINRLTLYTLYDVEL